MVKLKAPVDTQGKIGAHLVPNTRPDAGEVVGFVLLVNRLFNLLKAIVKKEQKLKSVLKFFMP